LSERKCALESAAYQALREYYLDRDKAAREWKMSGKKTVLTLGDDVPDEIIIAGGMLPLRVAGQFGEQPEADKYLEHSFGPVWRAMWEKIVGGKSAWLYDFIAISKSSDMLIRMFYYLRELKRFEPERPIAPIKFLDYELIMRTGDSQKWNESETREFIQTVEGWTSSKITDEKLRRASEICNRNRAALRAFAALRKDECRVTGTEALTVMGAALFMEKEKSTGLIEKLTEEAKSWPVVDAVPIYYTGSLQEDLEVYSLIEELGGNVVAEDHDWGERHFDGDVNTAIEPFRAITARYMYRMPASERGLVADRCRAIVDKIKEDGAKALLVYMNYNDESYLLDYPSQKKELDALGIPSADITLQQVPMVNKEAAAAKIKALIDTARA